MSTSYCLEAPSLFFGEDGVPRSASFDDVYFDKEAGLAETQYVFIDMNQLPTRFAALPSETPFTIGETGFGTGLNFLCAWAEFDLSNSEGWLHFVSVEKFPLDKKDLATALSSWESLSPYSEKLLEQYPLRCKGWHQLSFPEHRVTLTIWFGEAAEGLGSLRARVDAWFLDGFAPSKNPQMWNDELFSAIQRLSHQNTTCATFTSAGIVRRGLQNHGFKVEKVKGFGRKREMVCAHYLGNPTSEKSPWFYQPHHTAKTTDRILVVGSGIAGASTAFALAQKGFHVEVWDANEESASGGSGNVQGMLYPKLQATDTPINRFYLSGFQYANRFFSALCKQTDQAMWQQCGLRQSPKDEKEAERFRKMVNSGAYPDCILESLADGSLHYPLSGWVAPQKTCRILLSHQNIHLKLKTKLTSLKYLKATNRWQAESGNHQQEFDYVVLCTASEANHHLMELNWPLKPIRGQVTQAHIDQFPLAAQEKLSVLNHVLCADGYVSPPLEQHVNFGATYDLASEETELSKASHYDNLAKLSRLIGEDVSQVDLKALLGRVGFRCTVSDYAPIVGAVSDPQTLDALYSPLRTNAKWQPDSMENPNHDLKGLFVNIGHGSRGLVSAPLSGLYIADLISGTPSPLETEVAQAIHPNRFIIRQLKRGEK